MLEKILYIDDEDDIRAIAQIALEAVGGFQIGLSASGQEALALIPQFQPDLILLDVFMPEMDGPQTLAEIRRLAQGRDVPVIFLTAQEDQKELQRLETMDVIGILPKPFDPMLISLQIMDLWRAYHSKSA